MISISHEYNLRKSATIDPLIKFSSRHESERLQKPTETTPRPKRVTGDNKTFCEPAVTRKNNDGKPGKMKAIFAMSVPQREEAEMNHLMGILQDFPGYMKEIPRVHAEQRRKRETILHRTRTMSMTT